MLPASLPIAHSPSPCFSGGPRENLASLRGMHCEIHREYLAFLTDLSLQLHKIVLPDKKGGSQVHTHVHNGEDTLLR